MGDDFSDIVNFILDDGKGIYTKYTRIFGSPATPLGDRLVFGKYKSFEGSGKDAWEAPYNRNILSKQTQKNLITLENNGWTFSKIIGVPTQQDRRWRSPNQSRTRFVLSFYIFGKDAKGRDVLYARRETSSFGSGQTWIYYKDRKFQASRIIGIEYGNTGYKDPDRIA